MTPRSLSLPPEEFLLYGARRECTQYRKKQQPLPVASFVGGMARCVIVAVQGQLGQHLG
ncbi:hypothetical protein DPMN_146329 [Dreissena polymorpha]|uniref:Uncharacterized protein n=1 Tax=Dreissena polymorpha TaxID=45954 RepID=A0A9D4IZL9_DREPO|nr:hypothetical protein DPMN_146329 [Dreissena polymorpha]